MRISDWSSDVCSSDLREFAIGGVEEEARGFDRIARDHYIFRSLKAPIPFTMIMNAGCPAVLHLDPAHHGQIPNLRASAECAGQPCHEHGMFGIGRTSCNTKAALHERCGLASARCPGGHRLFRPLTP